ncbi:MAG TPA: hypothetical protein VIC30_05820 [Orrella sp.]
MYHYTDGGLRNVWLANGYEIKQTPYGEGVVFHNLDGLTRCICLALTRKPSKLTGAEFRYIRSAGMLLSQPALGKLIGIDGQSVARWEKTARFHAGLISYCACYTPPMPKGMNPLPMRLNGSRPLSAWSNKKSL